MRSLRGRLTLGVALVVAVLLLAAGAVASHYVASSERAALDDRLERTAELSRVTALATIQEGLPDPDRRLDDVLSASGTSLRLTLGGRVVLDTGAPPAARPRLRRGLQTFDSGGKRYRAYVTALRDPGLGGLARLEVVSALAPLEHRQAQLEHRLLALGLIALVAAGIGVWLAADLVLRPLRRLRTVASSVAEDEDLDRRVPPGGSTELRSLAASFNAMLARLGRSAADRERALAATRRFTADAGHELRTPLTSVQATLSTLQRHLDLPPERRAEMLGDALAEQARLVELLDGLQALARGDAGPLELTDIDLAEVVDAAASAARERHPACGCTPTSPMRPSRCAAGSPGCGCWPTTWWRTPSATAAPAARSGSRWTPHARARTAARCSPSTTTARASPTPTGPASSPPSRAWKPPTARARASASRSSSSRFATTARASRSASRRSAGRASACASRRARSKRVHPLARSKRVAPACAGPS